MTTYKIKDWSSHYENNRTRELKRLDWVPVPNRMDGDGYTELLDHPAGASHLGAWLALVQIASRCDPRGTLVRDGGKPHDFRSLSRISRIPAEVFADALPRFAEIGWVEVLTVREFRDLQKTAEECDNPAPPCDNPAPRGDKEGNGTEGNGREQATLTSWQSDDSFRPFVEVWREVQAVTDKPLIEDDFAEAHFRWKKLDPDQKAQATQGVRLRLDRLVWAGNTDPQYIPMPKRYLETEWKRPVVGPKPREKVIPLPPKPRQATRDEEIQAMQDLLHSANEPEDMKAVWRQKLTEMGVRI